MVMIKDQVLRLRDVRNLLRTILEDVNPEEVRIAEKRFQINTLGVLLKYNMVQSIGGHLYWLNF